MKRTTLFFLGLLLVVNGCSLAPQYVRPELPVADEWAAKEVAGDDAVPARVAAEIPRAEFFADARLQAVIDLALANNRDLRIAALTVDRVRAAYRIQRAELYPDLGISAGGERYRVPEGISATGQAYTAEQYDVSLGAASWELDFFGRVRSLKESALNQYLATEQARSAAEISLVAAVATSYLALAADQENMELAKATLEAQQATYELIRQSRDLGIANDVELRQAQSQVEVARVDAARFAGLVAVDRNALSLLAGVPVPEELLPGGLGKVTGMGDIAPDLPSEVLLRRPDILMAEYELRAANASIGAARAAFFPRISLTAAAGSISTDLSDLLGSGTGTWSFAPRIDLPIFTGGARRAGLEAARVDREIAVAEYEVAIQTAFREVNDALTLRESLTAEQEAQESLVEALDETHRLSDARYRAGLDGYLDVLVAQRSLYVAQQGLVRVRLERQVNAVTLFKVLGGGGSEGPGDHRGA